MRKTMQYVNKSVMLIHALSGSNKDGLVPKSYANIATPLDGSRRAECVLPLVISIAKFHEAQILVVNAITKPELPYRYRLSARDHDLQQKVIERNRETASEYLSNIRFRLPSGTQTRLIVSDNAKTSLHNVSQIVNADLVVLSAHGYSGHSPWPYGSICNSFIDYGKAPLLIIQDFQCDELESAPTIVNKENFR